MEVFAEGLAGWRGDVALTLAPFSGLMMAVMALLKIFHVTALPGSMILATGCFFSAFSALHTLVTTDSARKKRNPFHTTAQGMVPLAHAFRVMMVLFALGTFFLL